MNNQMRSQQRIKQSVALLAAVGSIASAGTVSQTVNFDYSALEGTTITMDRFDTMGGTRQLTGIRLAYDHNVDLAIRIESNGPTSVSAGDWDVEAGFSALHQFGVFSDGRRGGDGPSFPLVGIGGAFDVFTSDLGPSDGYNGTGPDTYVGTSSNHILFNFNFDASTQTGMDLIDIFSQTGPLETFMGGFSEILGQWHNDPMWEVDPNNPPDGPFDGPFGDPYYGIFATFESIHHYGSIGITFEYTTVPAPAGTCLLLGAGMVGIRRRR